MIAAGLIVIPQSRAIPEKNSTHNLPARLNTSQQLQDILRSLSLANLFPKRIQQATLSGKKKPAANPDKKTGIIIAQDTVTNVAGMQTLKSTTEPIKTEIPKQPINNTNTKFSLKADSRTYSKTQITPANNNHYKKEKSKSGTSRKGYGKSYTSGRSGYVRGPRGGCYYINSNGNKVYVDHSYCT